MFYTDTLHTSLSVVTYLQIVQCDATSFDPSSCSQSKPLAAIGEANYGGLSLGQLAESDINPSLCLA